MKKLLTFAALTVFAAIANAQQYGVVTPSLGTLTSITAAKASNNIVVIDAKKTQNVAVQVSFKLSGSGTGVQTLYFARSLDGSFTTKDTIDDGILKWAIAGNGATTVVATTNLPANPAGYWALTTWTNADASRYVTNISVKYSAKINAP